MAAEASPLLVKPKDLNLFAAEIGPAIRKAFDLPEHRYLSCQKYETNRDAVTETYRILDSSEHAAKVIDLRGNELDAVKLLSSQSETVLTTVSFDWTKVGKAFRFSGAQFAIFVGRVPKDVADDGARQLFRLEWQGRQDDGSFEAAVAAHPHWQVDAIPTTKIAVPAPVASADLGDLLQKREPTRKTWMTHVHLPCAANDWAVGDGWSGDPADCGAHASSPDSLESLSSWVLSASRYLKHQIGAAISR